MSEKLECINGGFGEAVGLEIRCEGPVELRMPLTDTGIPYPRCEKHWAERLEQEQRLRQDYPDSPHPPSWFDPSYAGETWDDDY
jgi:hypothetical protein